MRHTVRSATLNGFAAVARSVGLDPDAMLDAVRLDRRMLADPDTRIPVAVVVRLLDACARAAGAEDFGLRLAESRTSSNLGAMGLVVSQEPTLHRALEVMVRYVRLHNESLHLKLEEAGGVVVLSLTLITGRPLPMRQAIELAVGALHRILRSMLGDAWKPRRICFVHAPPSDLATHRRVFGDAELEFGADFDGIVCRASDLEKPIPASNPVFSRYAREYLDALAQAAAHDGLASQLQHLVRTLLPSGRCTVDRIAQHLGVDRRTVHRHLAREGTTFSTVLGDVRRQMVLRYVPDGKRSLADVADLLGFATPSAFSVWFKAQYGCSPGTWRARFGQRRTSDDALPEDVSPEDALPDDTSPEDA